jgi:murein DD-endopeptidase MepM/ murein hydrolase activator NlpD
VQSDLSRRRWRSLAGVAAAAFIGSGCTGGGEAPSARAGSGESTSVAQAHVNGAELDSAPRGSGVGARAQVPAAASLSNGNGAATIPAPATAAGTPVPAPAPPSPGERGDAARSAAVASTPDELSALAASLVVPVAGVTPAELRGSFTASRGGGARQHNALDIPAPRGTPVIAATAGRVLRLYNSKAGGLMVYATDPTERFILMYGHLDRYADGLKDGMPLQRGQTIGYVGTTGNAPPDVPHLHFAIARTTDVKRWWTGTPIDPAPLFKR